MILLAASALRADAVDLSGTYVSRIDLLGIPCSLTFAQAGTGLHVLGPCNFGGSYTVDATGTVDAGTGAFTVSGQITGFCTGFSLTGSGDGEVWSGSGACSGFASTLGGTKCSNGVVDPAEQCEDGNTVDGDCCSALCRYEPSGNPCTPDSNPCKLDVCNGTGFCSHPAAPAGTPCTSDSNVCTDDVCNAASTCQHPPNTVACDDGNACSTGDVCAAGACHGAGVAPECVGSIDLTGTWWVHPDPFPSYDLSGFGNAFNSAIMDVVQTGATLAFTNVQPAGGGASPGTGGGAVNPATGELSASYGYVFFFEPIVTFLQATASPDGLTLTGSAITAFVFGSGVYAGPVIGVRYNGEPAVCGDGVLQPRETCDDGNAVSGDGCSATCIREPLCGDGIKSPSEECDDGNLANGDGCDATCVHEPRCGDGFLDPGEECDDHNTMNGDTCSSTCTALVHCGNGVKEFGEICDDGNNVNGDCCSSGCLFELHVCRPKMSKCDSPESCDHGVCPPDTGNGDADGDLVCDNNDPCLPVGGTRYFLDRGRPRLSLAKVNDGVDGNEHLSLRATFDVVPPSPTLTTFDPTTTVSWIQVTYQTGDPVLSAILGGDVYAGPGTRGWVPGRRWEWRDRTSAPLQGIRSVRIKASPLQSGDRVRVRVEAKSVPFGIPATVASSLLPLRASVTLGSWFPSISERCGQSLFTATDCSLPPGGTKVLCQR